MDIDEKFVKKYDGLISNRLEKSGIHGDLYDEIKAKVYERILTSNSYDPLRGKISTWLWNICRSVISNEVKKAGRSQDAMDHQPIQLEDANNIIGMEDAGDARDELARLIRNVGISKRDQGILTATQLDDYTSQETADMYGMEVRAVQQVIYRAMKALRESVDRDA